MKTYLATKAQLDSQNQALAQIDAKLTPMDLTDMQVAILDFAFDDITIVQGALNTVTRRIST